ncbi:MAG: FliB family protein [Lachnospiraceae bacterium]|nr:FliB family protein [Lachnospiraceae bacterium]
MLYTYPDYYERFKCVAGECEDTCCAGWQIVIDEESLEKYKKITKGKDKRIDFKEGVFKQDGERRCAFLNSDNLCDMYIEWGEDSFCETCRKYPRHIEEFENVREYTLSMSCPEAARIILGYEDKVGFVMREDDLEEEDEEFDALLFSVLEDAREIIYRILQDREKSISDRVKMLISLAEVLQEKIDEDDIFSAVEDMERCADGVAEAQGIYSMQYEASLKIFKRLYDMEVLNEFWADMTDEAAETIYCGGEALYNDLQKEFLTWLDANISTHNIVWEQILVYFISVYFCGAVYDGNALGKVRLAVMGLVCIFEMLKARWLKNEKQLGMEDIVTVAYLYSRELEHSDINLEVVEQV